MLMQVPSCFALTRFHFLCKRAYNTWPAVASHLNLVSVLFKNVLQICPCSSLLPGTLLPFQQVQYTQMSHAALHYVSRQCFLLYAWC